MLLEYERKSSYKSPKQTSKSPDFTFVLGNQYSVDADGKYTLDKKEDSFLDVIDALGSLMGKLDMKKSKRIRLDVSGLTDTVRRTLFGMLAKRVFWMEGYISDPEEVRSRKKNEKVFVAVDHASKQAFWEDMILRVRAGDFARLLSSEPSNFMYPGLFCDAVAREFSRFDKNRVSLKCFDEHDIARMGMGGLHHIGKGSVNPPRLLVIEADLNPKTASAKSRARDGTTKKESREGAWSTCLVGKGVTFDTGGINLKSTNGMETMHMDKTGGGVVVGIMHYLLSCPSSHFRSGEKVVALVALVENMPGGNALKPRDIITAYNGKTIEVDNTDAEGRLVLADAMSYACDKYRPGRILDFATLTGWSSQLFCDSSFVYFAADETLSHAVEEASARSGERTLRMPKYVGYARYTSSTVADLKNASYTCTGDGAGAGSGYLAAMFLSHFVPKRMLPRWVHLDITHTQTQKEGLLLNNANSVDTGFELLNHFLGRK